MTIPDPVVTTARLRRRARRPRVRARARALPHREAARRQGAALLDRLRPGALAPPARRDRSTRLSAIPLGGYVKMLGEDADGDEPVAARARHRAFSTQSPLRRAAIIVRRPGRRTSCSRSSSTRSCSRASARRSPSTEPRVGGVSATTPADRAGLKPATVVVVDRRHARSTRGRRCRRRSARSEGKTLHAGRRARRHAGPSSTSRRSCTTSRASTVGEDRSART